VRDNLDTLGDAAAKLWNVARWTANRVWDAIGEIPDVGPLKAYMKTKDCWKNLNSQSSQKFIEELSDAFQSWPDLRHTDETANPPGYRKEYRTRPRSTVTFKEDGFKHDPNHHQVRLSKGENLKTDGVTPCCANMRIATTLISARLIPSRASEPSGTVRSGQCISSVKR